MPGLSQVPATAGLSFNNMHLALDAAIAGHGVVLARTIAAADLATGRLVRVFSLALPDLVADYIVTAPGALERCGHSDNGCARKPIGGQGRRRHRPAERRR